MSPTLRFLSAATAVASSVLAASHAQDTNTQLPQFRATTELIRLDVTVLDKKRIPVRGLTASDFIVLDDGIPREISSFLAVDLPDFPETAAAWTREVAPDVRRNDNLHERGLIVIILDDAGAAGDLGAQKILRSTASQIVDRLRPSDLVAIIYTLNNRLSVDFTDDRGALRNAISSYQVGPSGSVWYDQRRVSDVLANVVKTLNDIPNRRKTVFYLGGGWDIAGDIMPRDPGIDPFVFYKMMDMFRDAQRGNVNVYAIPTGGCCATSDFHATVSNETGGFMFGGLNDMEKAVDTVFLANSSYYLIGYQSPHLRDGRYHRVEVKVKRDDVRVVSRSGYKSEDSSRPEKPKEVRPSADLEQSMSGLLPKADLPMQIAASSYWVPGRLTPTTAVVLGLRHSLASETPGGTRVLNVRVEAFTTDGDSKGREVLTTRVRAQRSGPIGYEVLAKLSLPAGRYQIRAAAEDVAGKLSGSVYTDVTVREPPRRGVTMGSIMFSTNPALPSSPVSTFANELPFVPTGLREFLPSMRVRAFLQLGFADNNSLGPVDLFARVTNESDQVVHEEKTRITPPPFEKERRAWQETPVPVSKLPAGHYLLTFLIESGPTGPQRRDVRFVMR